MMMKNKSVILLSGGLDSLVCMGVAKENYNISLALTFDYGQKSAKQEIEASKKICDYYEVEHKVIKLDWLKDICNNALTSSDKDLPEGIDNPVESAKAVWVPNRNGLFLNIAAAYCEAENFTHVIIGANSEEAKTFPDNSLDFVSSVNEMFKHSTMTHPVVAVPLINLDKNAIVKLALERSVPLDLVYSCYNGSGKHCGKCESCTRLKNALINNGDTKYMEILFKE